MVKIENFLCLVLKNCAEDVQCPLRKIDMKNTFMTKTTTMLTPTEKTREKNMTTWSTGSTLMLIQAEIQKMAWTKSALVPLHIFFAYFYICCSCFSPLFPSSVSSLLRLEVLEQQTGCNHKIILGICFFSSSGDCELKLLAPPF